MLDEQLNIAKRILEQLVSTPRHLYVEETGVVTFVGQGIAHITGLPNVQYQETVRFQGGQTGMALNLAPTHTGVILFKDANNISAGMEVQRTHHVADVPVGRALLGRVIDATGAPLDNLGPLGDSARWPIEREAPGILDRAPVTLPLETGIKAVDALIPVGHGQRELILGDRQTGKTTIAIDTIINQAKKNVVCIYCAIGQRSDAVAKVVSTLRERGALSHTIVVVAAGDDSAGLQYITPYAATTIGEYFMQQGEKVLIVYDDLTRHAQAYRELSLLLQRPPGREAFPGDIFFIHSRLLERSTHLRKEFGGGSLTALPIIETEAQNIAAYIPTNLVSITDGQIYLSPDLYQKGTLPAVDIGKSVSRVGGKTQLPAYRAVTGELRLSYSQYEELETFARFGTRLDDSTRRTIERGRRVREILKQREHESLSSCEQIAVMLAVTKGLFDDVKLEDIRKAETAVRSAVIQQCPQLCKLIHSGEQLEMSDQTQLISILTTALQQAFSR